MKLMEAEARCLAVQKMVFEQVHGGKAVNSFSVEKEGWTTVRPDGSTGICDISYESTMPNGFLDIWYPNSDHEAKRPTIVNFHGGGFLFGDKVEGDPLAVKSQSKTDLMGVYMQQGYNYVSANYAFAPEYRFPSQIVQVNEVLAFLKAHAGEYGLDMSRIVLTGGSAGADFTQIYAMAVADPDYAKAIGVTPAVTMEELKCVIINEAALIAETQVHSENMVSMIQNWFGDDDFTGCIQAKLANIPSHIKGVYPPAYIIASNQDSFFEADAAAMDEVLTRYGLPHKHYYRGPEVEDLPHGFLGNFETSPSAKECLAEVLEFMNMFALI